MMLKDLPWQPHEDVPEYWDQAEVGTAAGYFLVIYRGTELRQREILGHTLAPMTSPVETNQYMIVLYRNKSRGGDKITEHRNLDALETQCLINHYLGEE